jgi:hypothetical protein
MYDPFLKAASSGSTDTLCVLLERCAIRPDRTEVVDAQGNLLLHTACGNAQVDTVCFLLENEPRFRDTYTGIGDIHARDTVGEPQPVASTMALCGETFDDTVLSLAIRGASYELVNRLIDEGANGHIKKLYHFNLPPYSFGGKRTFQDVTLLHIGSLYLNTAGIQALFDR